MAYMIISNFKTRNEYYPVNSLMAAHIISARFANNPACEYSEIIDNSTGEIIARYKGV